MGATDVESETEMGGESVGMGLGKADRVPAPNETEAQPEETALVVVVTAKVNDVTALPVSLPELVARLPLGGAVAALAPLLVALFFPPLPETLALTVNCAVPLESIEKRAGALPIPDELRTPLALPPPPLLLLLLALNEKVAPPAPESEAQTVAVGAPLS